MQHSTSFDMLLSDVTRSSTDIQVPYVTRAQGGEMSVLDFEATNVQLYLAILKVRIKLIVAEGDSAKL